MTRLQAVSSVVILFLIFFVEYQVTAEANNWMDDTLQVRVKRQLEDFDSDDVPPEEPGFWDRVVKVALRLFNKFIEWLNSS